MAVPWTATTREPTARARPLAYHNLCRRRRVQATGGFVEHEDLGLLDERDRDGEAALLPPTHALDELVPDASVFACLEAGLGDDAIHHFILALLGALEVELGGVGHDFAAREEGPVEILLGHAVASFLQEAGGHWEAVQGHLAPGDASEGRQRQHVDEGGLAGTRGLQRGTKLNKATFTVGEGGAGFTRGLGR